MFIYLKKISSECFVPKSMLVNGKVVKIKNKQTKNACLDRESQLRNIIAAVFGKLPLSEAFRSFCFTLKNLSWIFYPLKTILEYLVLCRTRFIIIVILLAMFKTFSSVFLAIVGCCMMQT